MSWRSDLITSMTRDETAMALAMIAGGHPGVFDWALGGFGGQAGERFEAARQAAGAPPGRRGPAFGPAPFRIRVNDLLAIVDRPANILDPDDEKVLDDLGNWWHLAPPPPASVCGNCGADLTWAYSTSAWARADEPERGREICRHPGGSWKPHVPVSAEEAPGSWAGKAADRG